LKKILIIGAGWAGLSAAVEATRRGAKVTLVEAKSELGGRARSVQLGGLTLDNGQHIMIGAYRATLELMASVGLNPESLLLRCRLSLLDNKGNGFSLKGPAWLPPSVQFLLGILNCSHWSVKDKSSLIGLAIKWTLQGFRCESKSSVKDICKGATDTVMESLLLPLCLCAFNTPIEMTSGRVFLRVLKDAMFTVSGGSDFLIPRCDLGELFPQSCERWLLQMGCEIHKNTRIKSLSSLSILGDLSDKPDAVIVACDPTNAARLTADINPQWADSANRIEYTQIATTYLRCNAPSFESLGAPVLMLQSDSTNLGHVQAPAQFVFDRGFLFKGSINVEQAQLNRRILSFVSSYATLSNDQTASAVLEQARIELGLSHLEHLGTITERRATFCCTPELLRPSIQVSERIWACGDFTDGPYPSTLEGAVLSGMRAVKEAFQTLERN